MIVGGKQIITAQKSIEHRFEYSLNYAMTKIKESQLAQYVDQLYLYGSYARHQHRYDSDIDLLLELKETVNVYDYRDDVFRLIGQVCPPNLDYPEVQLKVVVGDNWKTSKMLFYQNVKRDCINIWNLPENPYKTKSTSISTDGSE